MSAKDASSRANEKKVPQVTIKQDGGKRLCKPYALGELIISPINDWETTSELVAQIPRMAKRWQRRVWGPEDSNRLSTLATLFPKELDGFFLVLAGGTCIKACACGNFTCVDFREYHAPRQEKSDEGTVNVPATFGDARLMDVNGHRPLEPAVVILEPLAKDA